ncbi:MAG: glycerol-3-phosphate 1-O-acyltransferase PlsY [Candidatus Margulisbacteria bacterium]|jgi:glycerol-3-phosphate acyltransferase PlsY|nr:glycerol-3-phosphate 1-O-acyltransferase PlsY [Candidatus Margulisiibacteriota bacterium]
MTLAAALIACYLLGSVPFSYIFAKLRRGVDPRRAGTGNVGASNALIVGGKMAALLAVIGDTGKGILAIMLARSLHLNEWGLVLCALVVVLGHDFSLFLGFKGGKGVATTGGVIFALNPFFGVIVTLLWLLCMLMLRRFIPGTLLTFTLVPLVMWLGSMRTPFILWGIVNAALAFYAHRQDLERFLAGNELTIAESLEKIRKK